MVKILKCMITVFTVFICAIGNVCPAAAAVTEIELSDEEKAFIYRTQNGSPLKTGIIPHAFPLSACPPEAPDYQGLNIEMLSMITQVSGLTFEYGRISLEEKTPYKALQDRDFTLVAGTIKLENFLNDPHLILSDRLCDGSAACIAKRDSNPTVPVTGKVAVMSGYQAGKEFSEKQFPSHKVIFYPNNQDVMKAVRTGAVDLAMISRYVGIYELQNPLNENLMELTPYQTQTDSCVMGLNTSDNQMAISIINKSLAAIGEDGYNYVQMNFTITNPYKLTVLESIYKYRYFLVIACIAFIIFAFLSARLLYAQRKHKLLSLDPLTGAFTETGFELAVAKIIPKTSRPLFITDFDINHFSGYNELNGKEQGDVLLKNIVKIVKSFLCEQDIICRSYADHFKVLTCKDNVESLIEDIRQAFVLSNELAQSAIVLNFGIYPITDNSVPISKMFDFASIAKKNVKNNHDTFIGVFDKALLERHISDARMTSSFHSAILNKEFIPYYQPKFDAATKEIIGAEALVRWMTSDGTLIPPFRFIELFEKNGQIQQLDFYMLEQVCIFLKNLSHQRIPVVPIAVNFSRVHLYSSDFVHKVNQIVEQYGIPKQLIEIECTETTMINNTELTKQIFGKLQEQGFSIAMDDFGSAYSSLNSLCSIPLDIIKLDGGFLAATLSNEKDKANIIISSVTSLAHDLSLKIVAEGVETEEQYLFLKGLGCDFIQGYYFSKPLEEQRFLKLLTDCI